ncbi:Peroxidase 42 [Apostasia shenzhenica]|uniref:Peroxidase 42 n=1 Tax=Apostasia shenzhenica TaxID=1088818 RepID=A0A2I0B7M4_9ASPA|nr:Peroxidase 42 [Apostasia shenzhenica]
MYLQLNSLIFFFLALSALSSFCNGAESTSSSLAMNFYKESCPQAEDIIREHVKLLYKRHKNTAFSWLCNLFHDYAVQSCDASLLLDSTRKTLSEKETDRSFGMRNFRYLEDIKDAVERECPGVVSCADMLVLSARDGIVAVRSLILTFFYCLFLYLLFFWGRIQTDLTLGGPYIPLKTGRRDGRKSRSDVLEQYLPDHNESISSVLDKFAAIGIDIPGVVALLGNTISPFSVYCI